MLEAKPLAFLVHCLVSLSLHLIITFCSIPSAFYQQADKPDRTLFSCSPVVSTFLLLPLLFNLCNVLSLSPCLLLLFSSHLYSQVLTIGAYVSSRQFVRSRWIPLPVFQSACPYLVVTD